MLTVFTCGMATVFRYIYFIYYYYYYFISIFNLSSHSCLSTGVGFGKVLSKTPDSCKANRFIGIPIDKVLALSTNVLQNQPIY